MRRLSKSGPYKLVIPACMVGLLALFEATAVLRATSGGGGTRETVNIIGLGAMLAFASVILWRQYGLVHEVWDAGDALVVRSKGMEQRIALSDVEEVTYEWFIRGSRRTTVWLHRPGVFGAKIVFDGPPMVELVVDELNRRIGVVPPITASDL